jgi:hypothetical protein
VFEIHKSICRPQLFLKFFSGDQLTGTIQEHQQNGKRLTIEPDTNPLFSEFTRAWFELVVAESIDCRI